MKPYHLLTGWPDRHSPMHFMRYGWVAESVNSDPSSGMRYELFKPWRRYDAVVFLKSMEAGCADFAERLKHRGTRVIFEANVDYYTEGGGDAPRAFKTNLSAEGKSNQDDILGGGRDCLLQSSGGNLRGVESERFLGSRPNSRENDPQAAGSRPSR